MNNRQDYLKESSRVANIHCSPINDHPRFVDAKSVSYGRLSWENMVVFPRAPSELSVARAAARKQARLRMRLLKTWRS